MYHVNISFYGKVWYFHMQQKKNLEDVIKSTYNSLSKGEKKVAKYILDNYASSPLLSSSEIAARADVSDTTVIRFAKSLGFNGFIDFKKALRSNVHTSNMYRDLQDMKINLNDQYAANYMISTVGELQNFIKTLDYEQINEIVHLILESKQLYIGGLGSDAIVANYLFGYIRKIGFKPILLVEEGHTLKESLLNITKKDVLITCNFPKMFSDETEMTRIAKSRGAKIISITDSEVSAMELKCDYSIIVPQKNKTYFNSYVIQMAICNLLLLKIYEFAPERVDSSLKAYTDMVNYSDD